jgi:DNA-binding transcriptional MerR regulator
MTDPNQTWTPEQFEAETGVPRRNLRYLASLGVIPRPYGSRPAVTYGADHLDAIRLWKKLDALGLTARGLAQLSTLSPDEIDEVAHMLRRVAALTETKETA